MLCSLSEGGIDACGRKSNLKADIPQRVVWVRYLHRWQTSPPEVPWPFRPAVKQDASMRPTNEGSLWLASPVVRCSCAMQHSKAATMPMWSRLRGDIVIRKDEVRRVDNSAAQPRRSGEQFRPSSGETEGTSRRSGGGDAERSRLRSGQSAEGQKTRCGAATELRRGIAAEQRPT